MSTPAAKSSVYNNDDTPEELAVWKRIQTKFPVEDAPLMHAQIAYFKKYRPLEGVRVLHNVPVTLSTLFKLQCLMYSGAQLTVTDCEFVPSHAEAVGLLKQTRLGNCYVPSHKDCAKLKFDIVCDVCAEMSDYVEPRLGSVELTQTGDVKFRTKERNYPIVSVDDSNLKKVEDALGSADGTIRALLHFLPKGQNLDQKRYVVFGFGKVGVGIAQRLSQLPGAHITVVDVRDQALERAKKEKYDVFSADQVSEVEGAVSKAFGIVTCTGVSEFISDRYNVALFKGKMLCNIGTEDEFGSKINKEDKIYEVWKAGCSLFIPFTR